VGQELPAPLVVKVVDANNRPVEGQLVNFKVVSGGGSVFAGAAITNANGEARERWTLGTTTAEPQRVEARAVKSKTGEAILFATFGATARPGAPTALQAVGSASRSGVAGRPVKDSLAVRVVDQYKNPVAGIGVSWAVRAGAGSVSGQSTTTDASGVAKTQWTFGTRADSAQAAEAVTGTLPIVRFDGTATAGEPASIVLAAGDGASIPVGAAHTIQARVSDMYGNPVAGHPVSWAIVSGNGAVASPTSITNASGLAAMTWLLGETAGTQRASAAVAGINAPVSFAVVGLPAAPATAEFLVQPTDTKVNMPISPSIRVAIKDRFGNLATNATAPVNLTLLAPNLAMINETGTQSIQAIPVDGVATFGRISINKTTPDFRPQFLASMQGWSQEQKVFSDRFSVLP
jgi:adhesin/invasin